MQCFLAQEIIPFSAENASSVQLFTLTNETLSIQHTFTPWQNYLNYQASTHVPEPGSLALVSLGAIALSLGY
jgi:hypothetical protein